ncbi:hypothetical protein CNR22_10180 [Sphingobacteriaceae bacterium]|nr:hypothetical protein CNR22_10180 [Sphingobacteriaceae bacterium]
MTFKMAHWLNNKFAVLFFCLFSGNFLFAQIGTEPAVYKDYKDPEQFDNFRRTRLVVGAWQINTLKEKGAIVVKLKTSKLLIDELLKQGNQSLALEKQLELFAVNRNTLFAYKENLNFCKVYFMYSNYSDSLLNGKRDGIFLDTNLVIDPSIKMKEEFYIIAESDFAYSSSIGFVPEDSARTIKETGNPIKLMAVVLKNKYGHQLKSPMPYATRDINFSPTNYFFPVSYTPAQNGLATAIYFPVNRTFLRDLKENPDNKTVLTKNDVNVVTKVKLKKEYTYEKISSSISQLNISLYETFKEYPKPDVNRINSKIKPLLY